MKSYKALQNGTDIRGIASNILGNEPNLSIDALKDLAGAFYIWLKEKTKKDVLVISVGRDSRLTGIEIEKAVISRLSDMGAKVYSFGLCTTPASFMATKFDEVNADGAIMITASHLPKDRNGLKFFDRAGGLEKEDISKLIDIAQSCDFTVYSYRGEVISLDFIPIYAKHLRSVICSELSQKEEDMPLKDLKVIVDAGNGAGGFFARDVLEKLGADCSDSLYLDPDGNFPNHIPNPEDKQAIECICNAVKTKGADLGIIFDTDVDRAAAVGFDGREIARNRIVALSSVLAKENDNNTTVVTDSVTSTQLKDFLENKLGLKHYRYKRGYKNVIDKAIDLNKEGVSCSLAIETSGHAAFRENYFLDDGAYLATKIVIKAAKIKKEAMHIEDLISEMEDPKESIEYRFKILDPDFSSYADRVLDRIKSFVVASKEWSLEEPNYEGVRVNTKDGWFLIRKSLHDPVIPLNIESEKIGGTKEVLDRVKDILKDFDKLN